MSAIAPVSSFLVMDSTGANFPMQTLKSNSKGEVRREVHDIDANMQIKQLNRISRSLERCEMVNTSRKKLSCE
jgi:hypothetical protein